MNRQRGIGVYGILGIVAAAGIVIAIGSIIVTRHFNHIEKLEATVQDQREAIAKHEANEAQYKATIESRDRQIDNLRTAMSAVQKHREEADEKFAAARERAEYTKKIFADHDFEKLARAKPGLISKRMQRATANVFQEFEDTANNF